MSHDTKPLLCVGLFWKAACCYLFGRLQEQEVTFLMQLMMLTAKLGMGITEALISVWATVWVQRNAPPDARARWLGFAGTSAGIGSGVGSGVASLWNPIYAFYAQAFVLFVIWGMLLATPGNMFRFGGPAEDDMAAWPTVQDVEQTSLQFPQKMLAEQAVRRVSKSKTGVGGSVFTVESVRLPGHYLDASIDPLDDGFKVRVTRGDAADGEWAQFKVCLFRDECRTFESLRLPGHFLDASGEKIGLMGSRTKVRLSELPENASPCNVDWAHFRFRRTKEAGVFHIESVRLPNHFLDATGERMIRGTKVALTQGNPDEGTWARFRVRRAVPESHRGTG